MGSKHLTDEQIQRLLDGQGVVPGDIAAHLRECSACHREVGIYQQIYEGLEQDDGLQLSPGFSESVIARLAASNQASSRAWRWRIPAFVGGAAIICAIVWLINLSPLLDRLSGLSAYLFSLGSPVVTSLQTVCTDLGSILPLVVATGLILLFFAALDRALLRSRPGYWCL
ncbi:MAG: hypothetical protein ABII79_09080 [bacterium]